MKFTGFCKKNLYNKVKGSMPKGFDNSFQEWFDFYSSHFFCKIKKPIWLENMQSFAILQINDFWDSKALDWATHEIIT